MRSINRVFLPVFLDVCGVIKWYKNLNYNSDSDILEFCQKLRWLKLSISSKMETKEESDSSRTSFKSPVVVRSFVSHEIRSSRFHIELAERLTFYRTKVFTFHGKVASPSIGRNRVGAFLYRQKKGASAQKSGSIHD